MKNFKHIALSALLTIGSFTAITYTACNKDACKDVTCNNGGTCSGGNCVCPTGYNGTNCQSYSIYGSWTGTDVCSGTSYNVNLTNSTSSADSSHVLVSNPGGFGTSVIITGTLASDGRTVTFSSQDVGGSRLLTGTMSLTSNSAFTFNYTVVGPSDNATCVGNYTRQ